MKNLVLGFVVIYGLSGFAQETNIEIDASFSHDAMVKVIEKISLTKNPRLLTVSIKDFEKHDKNIKEINVQYKVKEISIRDQAHNGSRTKYRSFEWHDKELVLETMLELAKKRSEAIQMYIHHEWQRIEIYHQVGDDNESYIQRVMSIIIKLDPFQKL